MQVDDDNGPTDVAIGILATALVKAFDDRAIDVAARQMGAAIVGDPSREIWRRIVDRLRSGV